MYRISKLTLAVILGVQMVSVPVYAEETDFPVGEQTAAEESGSETEDEYAEVSAEADSEETSDEAEEGETGNPDEGELDPVDEPSQPEPEPENPEEPSFEIREAEGVTRYAGADRYTTAVLFADELKAVSSTDKYENVIIASGVKFPDALTGGYLSYKMNAPILLSKTEVNNNVVSYINDNVSPEGTVYILGGKAALSDSYEKKLSGFNVKRISGETRYETNLAILNEAEADSGDLLIATGENFADGLSASAVKKPIMIVNGDKLTDGQKEYLENREFKNIYILGGSVAVSGKIADETEKITGVEPVRLAGNNRYQTSAAIARQFMPESRSSFVVDGENFPDGLSVSSLAMYFHGPVLLARTGIEKEAAAFNKEKGITSGYAAGGFGQFSDESIRKIFGLGNSAEIKGYVASGFYTVNKNRFYYDADTKSVLKGRQIINGIQYIFDYTTGALYEGWVRFGDNYAYCTGDGTCYKGWLMRVPDEYGGGSNTYYMDSIGLRTRGKAWIYGTLYYFDTSSGVRTSGWKRIEGEGQFYFDPVTYIGATGSKSINGVTYSFDAYGRYIPFPKAAAILNAVGWNLKSAYNWCVHNIRYVSITTDASLGIRYFANFGFDNRYGNCYVYAATLYEMAKTLGYEVTQMDGRVGKDWHKHSWVDIYQNGAHWVLDPDYEYELGKSGYFRPYTGGVGIKSYTAMKE